MRIKLNSMEIMEDKANMAASLACHEVPEHMTYLVIYPGNWQKAALQNYPNCCHLAGCRK
jgi:hypothetical protein